VSPRSFEEPQQPSSAKRAVGMLKSLLRPWRGATLWNSLAYDALGVPLGILIGVPVILLVGLGIGLAVTFVVAIPIVWVTFFVTSGLGSIERSRAAALLGVNLASPHTAPPSGSSWWVRLTRRLTSASRWREIAFLGLALPVLGALGGTLLALWALALTLVALPFFVSFLPGHSADYGVLRIHSGLSSVGALVVGVIGIAVVAPQFTMALANLERRTTRWLLGPRHRSALERKVDELEIRRGAAVDSAETERRRIERDLHDGAQQRLVALAMDLGRARERFDTDPEGARQLVDDAHEEAKAALKELRGLARGIHPAILTDRGLDAALSVVLARCPVPVTLSVELPVRPNAALESAAYFVVAEALTNVAKHAQASRAEVSVALKNERLVIEIRDNGVGGAQASEGSGLSGLSDRVTALGGWMNLVSPQHGPTTLIVELPCES
jgi:signal transduction histidine kinase